MRGEKACESDRNLTKLGSPPRARGKGKFYLLYPRISGITPACAGKRLVDVELCTIFWDHPRVRGEKGMSLLGTLAGTGSPPRARGKGSNSCGGVAVAGITPACAGKRIEFLRRCGGGRDHPRVRGEKTAPLLLGHLAPGITPACAGKRAKINSALFECGDHPRVRGEKQPPARKMYAA